MKNYTVLWSQRSKTELGDILDYLEQTFGDTVAQNCLLEVDAILSKIAAFPEMSPAYRWKKIRRAVFHKNLSLYFKIMPHKTVLLLSFWDNRRDPQKIQL